MAMRFSPSNQPEIVKKMIVLKTSQYHRWKHKLIEYNERISFKTFLSSGFVAIIWLSDLVYLALTSDLVEIFVLLKLQ